MVMATELESSNPIPAPMATYGPLERPVVVIGTQFLQQYPVYLTVSMSNPSGDFKITDVNGKLIFKVKSKSVSIHQRRSLKVASGNPLLSYRTKGFLAYHYFTRFAMVNPYLSLHLRTVHHRRQIFSGKDQEENLLFTAKKSQMFESENTNLDIFLAKNTAEETPDFKIIGGGNEGSCTIYLGNGESNTIIAQMQSNRDGNFKLTTYPGVDYAFTIALAVLVFLDEIRADRIKRIASTSAETAAKLGHLALAILAGASSF